MRLCIYSGSFDPFHYGHLEVINKASTYCDKVIVLPNNPRKNKPNRTNLILRSHMLSLIFPIFSDFSYLSSNHKIVVDTQHVQFVFDELSKSHDIILVIGSDIVKQPKLNCNNILVIERNDYPIAKNELLNNNPKCTYIYNDQLKYQNISSTFVKQNIDSIDKYVPKELVDLAKKQITSNICSLSDETISIIINNNLIIKTFINDIYAKKYYDGYSLLKTEIFTIPRVTLFNNVITEDYITNIGNFLQYEQYINILPHFFLRLSLFHQESNVVHGDMTITNVIIINETTFALTDFMKIKIGSKKDQLREFFQFIYSFKFYGLRSGINYDINLIKKIGLDNYANIINFKNDEINEYENYWKNK